MRATGSHSSAKAWMRALELTTPIARDPGRVLPTVIEEMSLRQGDAIALVSPEAQFTYSQLAERANQYARWALDHLCKGDVVCLLMQNKPEYLAIWLGITAAGGVVSLLNTNLIGPSLAHCIKVVAPRHLIAAAECLPSLRSAYASLSEVPATWVQGNVSSDYQEIDSKVSQYPGEALTRWERRPLSVEDRALFIYTSGTTGLPKAANVSHGRIMQWSHWFAGIMDAQSSDRVYDCLPMYHSVGGVQTPGAALVAGGTLIVREKFSASQFWLDVVAAECTIFQYIGELCRYLLHADYSPYETMHKLRLACGNGMARDVWDRFQERFHIPKILEFYASTEGGVSLFNVDQKQGAIGRVPAYLSHRFAPALVAVNSEDGELVRDDHGFCVRSKPQEPGEAIGRVSMDGPDIGNRFEGYVDVQANGRKILRGVFEQGDAWVRTGDLMRKDEQGFFYFVDRLGDTYRWKGENVATAEVAEAVCTFPGVAHAIVYGVKIPNMDGRAGMAAIVLTHEVDLTELRHHLSEHLPVFACPSFLRIRRDMEVTGTFKCVKRELVEQGYDPASSSDRLYVNSPDLGTYIPLDAEQFQLIQHGRIRL